MNTLEVVTFESLEAAVFYARHQRGFELVRDGQGVKRLRRQLLCQEEEASVVKAGLLYYLEIRKVDPPPMAEVIRLPVNWF